MRICAWATAHLERESKVRTVVFATGTLFSYLFSAFLPIAVFPASEAPHCCIGVTAYLGLSLLTATLFINILVILRWQEKCKRKTEIADEGSEHSVGRNRSMDNRPKAIYVSLLPRAICTHGAPGVHHLGRFHICASREHIPSILKIACPVDYIQRPSNVVVNQLHTCSSFFAQIKC